MIQSMFIWIKRKWELQAFEQLTGRDDLRAIPALDSDWYQLLVGDGFQVDVPLQRFPVVIGVTFDSDVNVVHIVNVGSVIDNIFVAKFLGSDGSWKIVNKNKFI